MILENLDKLPRTNNQLDKSIVSKQFLLCDLIMMLIIKILTRAITNILVTNTMIPNVMKLITQMECSTECVNKIHPIAWFVWSAKSWIVLYRAKALSRRLLDTAIFRIAAEDLSSQ